MRSGLPAVYWWVVLLTFIGVLGVHSRGSCRVFKSRCVSDTRLTGHTLAVWYNLTSTIRCMSRCFSNIKCESINYRIKMQECQFNSAAIGRLYVGEMGDGDVYCGPEEGEDLRILSLYGDVSSETATTRPTPRVTTPQETTTPQTTTTPTATTDASASYYCTNKPASGVYTIHYEGSAVGGVQVYCDMDTDSGGWIVFQRRTDASLNFYQNHQSYADGFGDINGNFWLGNQLLHDVTSTGQWQLRVDMTDWVGGVAYAQYDVFSIGASPGFRLNVGQYSGTAGDSMTHHNNFGFTTMDYDSDGATGGNCAIWLNGGWWYNACHRCALNGNYLIGGGVTERDQGLQWVAWKGFHYSLKETEMKIRLLSS